ncbi:MAG: hypothetical protein AAF226_18005 [Verrucomicrobiota bacterium]
MNEEKTDIQKLLKLKHYETPGESYFQDFAASFDPQAKPSNVVPVNFGSAAIKWGLPAAAAILVAGFFAAPLFKASDQPISAEVKSDDAPPTNIELNLNGKLDELKPQNDAPTQQPGVLPAAFPGKQQ